MKPQVVISFAEPVEGVGAPERRSLLPEYLKRNAEMARSPLEFAGIVQHSSHPQALVTGIHRTIFAVDAIGQFQLVKSRLGFELVCKHFAPGVVTIRLANPNFAALPGIYRSVKLFLQKPYPGVELVLPAVSLEYRVIAVSLRLLIGHSRVTC